MRKLIALALLLVVATADMTASNLPAEARDEAPSADYLALHEQASAALQQLKSMQQQRMALAQADAF